ncbi:MAG: helix-turn-helix domain-containing protein, partial [Acutalibacteraceae bacterium]
IKDLRKERNLTEKELAEILGVSQTGYSKYETGQNNIPTNILIKLAYFYDTSVDYILGRTNDKTPYKRTKTNCKHAKPSPWGEGGGEADG